MTDPAALVVVQKIPGRSLSPQVVQQENDKPDREFKPALRVLLVRTFLTKGSGMREEERPDVYTKFNIEIAERHKKTPFTRLIVDSTGIGSPIVSHCKELGLPVQGMNLHRKNQDEIFSNLKILLERRLIELPDNLELLSSLNCIVTERNRIGEYSFTHPSGTHDDLAYALALAVWAAGSGPPPTFIMMKQEPQPPNWRQGLEHVSS